MDRAGAPRSARWMLLVLVIVAVSGTAAAVVQRDRALDRAYEDAVSRASMYAKTTVSSALIPTDLLAPIEGPRRDQVDQDLRVVRVDPVVVDVRLWGLDRTLLFSTDRSDREGEPAEPGTVDEALTDGTATRQVVDEVPLFQTFVPITIRGATEPVAVVEVDQPVSSIEERAADRWDVIQLGGSAATGALGILALVSVFRSSRRKTRSKRRSTASGWDDGATDREEEAAVSGGAESEQIQELRERLRRSEAERAMLRAGRPETMMEAELRRLRSDLQDARSRAKAAEALVADRGELSSVQEQLSAAERQVAQAEARALAAEGRANAAEEQVRVTANLAATAEQRIDLLEAKLHEVAQSGVVAGEDGSEIASLRKELEAATERAAALERRVNEAEARAASLDEASADAGVGERLHALEERVATAEAKAKDAEDRLRALGDEEDGSSFRHTLGIRAAGRKLSAPSPGPVRPEEPDPDVELRTAIARGLRGPLTRAAGLTLSLQGSIGSGEGRRALRQLSSSLRRLDQLAADLHDVQRIEDGTVPIGRRRTDVTALLTTTLEEADQLQEDRLVRLDAERLHAIVDPDRFRQVVEGMLEAARERTRAGAAIVVRARRTPSGVWVGVEDDNRTPATIGPELKLAARLAELLGSELVADGSGFHVVLPVDDA